MSAAEQSRLLLLGIGGGGCRLAAAVRAAYGEGLEALGLDTDALSNRSAAAGGMPVMLLGGSRLAGNGTGGDAILGRLAGQDEREHLLSRLQGVRTAVVVTCLGGGTGSGAAPEVIRMLRDAGLATVCFAALPFKFEGEGRRQVAARARAQIDEHADSLVTVPLEALFGDVGEVGLDEALRETEAVMAAGVTLLWRLVSTPGFIALDAERLHTMVLHGGGTRFGYGAASGAARAAAAVGALRQSRLLQGGDALTKANAVLLGILAGPDLRLAEIGEVMETLRGACAAGCRIEMGTVLDRRYEGRVELVALAFESWGAAAGQAAEAGALEAPPVADAVPVVAAAPRRRVRSGKVTAESKLSRGATGRGRFQNVAPTLHDGVDLDVPTYFRRGIVLDR